MPFLDFVIESKIQYIFTTVRTTNHQTVWTQAPVTKVESDTFAHVFDHRVKGALRRQYTMLHDARHATPHHHFDSKWSRTGGMRRAPTDQICLDFLGGMTPGYSVAIALSLYEVGCINAPPWIGSERRFFSLLNATGRIIAYGIKLKIITSVKTTMILL